jgi:hypothetical protein
MDVNYQITVDDFRQGINAYRKKSTLTRWGFRFVKMFVILLIGTGLALLLFAPHNAALQNSMPLFFLGILWLFVIWVTPYLSARSQFRGSPSARGRINLEVSDSGLYFHSEYVDSRLLWPSFVTWVEEKPVFALFTNPKICLLIPKRAFSADQLIEFREMLREKIRS